MAVFSLPVPEYVVATITTDSSSHRLALQQQQANVIGAISKLPQRPSRGRRPLGHRHRSQSQIKDRSFIVVGAGIISYMGYGFWDRYHHEYASDYVVKGLVYAFKAILFLGLFGMLPFVAGQQTTRWWLGHQLPPIIKQGQELTTTSALGCPLRDALKQYPLFFTALFVTVNLLSIAAFAGYFQWRRRRRLLTLRTALDYKSNRLKMKVKKQEKANSNFRYIPPKRKLTQGRRKRKDIRRECHR